MYGQKCMRGHRDGLTAGLRKVEDGGATDTDDGVIAGPERHLVGAPLALGGTAELGGRGHRDLGGGAHEAHEDEEAPGEVHGSARRKDPVPGQAGRGQGFSREAKGAYGLGRVAVIVYITDNISEKESEKDFC